MNKFGFFEKKLYFCKANPPGGLKGTIEFIFFSRKKPPHFFISKKCFFLLVNPRRILEGIVAPLSYELPLTESQCRYYIATKGNSVFTKMGKIMITIDEENLDNKLRKILAERQREGVITIERVETTNYVVKPPTKKGDKPHSSPRPEDFLAAIKFIVRHAAKQNGQLIETSDRGIVGSYRFWLEDEAWCQVMDELLANHRDVIEAVLEHKQRADSVSILAPYIGEVIGLHLFQKSPWIQKVDLLKSFTAYYGKSLSSVQAKLSTSYPRWHSFNELVDKTLKIARGIEK